jgi:thiamine-monophosphate kinase
VQNERTITERLRKMAIVSPGSPVVLGIGDDCAIYRPRGSADDLLFTADMFIEGTHFLRNTHKPEVAGRKALVRSLSDIAAMGGSPRFCLISLCVPGWATTRWVDKFFDGALEIARATSTVLAGGDLSHGGLLACDVTVCGSVPRGRALLRSGARPGHDIYVSGLLGGSALGLRSKSGKARRRHLFPEPRLKLGRFLREELHATSAMDISDGLSLDLERLCLASGVNAEIEPPSRFPGATDDQALHGGEEYELLFTVRSGQSVPTKFEGLPITRIGRVTRPVSRPGVIMLGSRRLSPAGYDHFRMSTATVASSNSQ